jgi:hypothetical protein
MTDMSMSPEEQREFWEMQAQIKSVFNVIIGDKMDGRPGLAERMINIERMVDKIEDGLTEHTRLIASVKRSWKHILLALGIGILIGGLIFGWLTWRDAVEGVKFVK